MKQVKVCLDLFWIFFKIGILSFGGGPSNIPMVKYEVVDRRDWFDDHAFASILSLLNVLPGPQISKITGFIGWRKAGVLGLFVAIFAITLPTIALMIVGMKSYQAFYDSAWLRGFSLGILPVVAWMLIQLSWTFVEQTIKALGFTGSCIAFLLTLLMFSFGTHPAFIIIFAFLWAWILPVVCFDYRTQRTLDQRIWQDLPDGFKIGASRCFFFISSAVMQSKIFQSSNRMEEIGTRRPSFKKKKGASLQEENKIKDNVVPFSRGNKTSKMGSKGNKET